MIHWRSLELTSFLSPQTCTVRGLFAECGKWCRLYTSMYFENTFDILHWLGLADFLMHSHRKVLALYPKSHCRSWHSVSFCWSWSSFGSAEEDRGQWHLCSSCSNMVFLGAQADSIGWTFDWMKDSAWAALRQGHLASAEWRRKALSAATWSTCCKTHYHHAYSRMHVSASKRSALCSIFWLALHLELARARTAKAGNEMPIEALREHVIMAFNLPPSQYQLHLQYMWTTKLLVFAVKKVWWVLQHAVALDCAGKVVSLLQSASWQPRLPPLLPSHLGVFRRGAHFMHMRHFPLKFVRETLQKMYATGAAFPEAPTLLDPQQGSNEDQWSNGRAYMAYMQTGKICEIIVKNYAAEACPGLLKSWWNVSQNLVLTTTKPMLKIWIDLQKAMPYWQTMIQPTSSMQWKEMDLLLRCWKVSNLLLSSPPSVVLRCSFKAKSAAINTQQLSQMYKHNQTYITIMETLFSVPTYLFFCRGRHRSYSVSFAAVPALSQRKIGRRGNHGQAHQEQSRGRSSMVFQLVTQHFAWNIVLSSKHHLLRFRPTTTAWSQTQQTKSWSMLIYHESWSMTFSFNQIVSLCLEMDQCRPHPLKSWMQQISWRCKAMVGPIKMANQAGSVVILEWSWKTFALCLVTSKLCLQVHAFSMVYRWSLLLLSSFARSVATDGI